jgi:hypothetical protein
MVLEVRVGDEPGAVFVETSEEILSNSNLTSAKSAISMANDIRVNTAAKNETKDEIMGMAQLVENSAKKNAKNVTTVATREKKYPSDKKEEKTWHDS